MEDCKEGRKEGLNMREEGEAFKEEDIKYEVVYFVDQKRICFFIFGE